MNASTADPEILVVPADPGLSGEPTFADRLDTAISRSGETLQSLSARLAGRGISCSASTLSQWRRGRTHPVRTEALRALNALEALLDCPTGYLRPPASAGHGGASARREAERERELLSFGDEFAATRAAFGIPAEHELDILAAIETLRFDERRRFTGSVSQTYVRARCDGAERLLLSAYSLGDDGLPTPFARVPEAVRGVRLGRRRAFPASGQVICELVLETPLREGETAMFEVEVVPTGGPEAWTGGPSAHERRSARRVQHVVVCLEFDAAALPSAVWSEPPEAPNLAARRGSAPERSEPIPLLGTRAFLASHDPDRPGISVSWEWEDA